MHGFASYSPWLFRLWTGQLIGRIPKFLARSIAATTATFLIGNATAAAQSLDIQITSREVRYEDFVLIDVRARTGETGADVEVAEIHFAKDSELGVRDLKVHCDTLEFKAGTACAGAPWSLILASADAWKLPLNGSIERLLLPDGAWSIKSTLQAGELKAGLSAGTVDGKLTANLDWDWQSLSSMGGLPMVPEQLSWVRTGEISAQLQIDLPEDGTPLIAYESQARDLSFDSPEGRYAGEGLKFGVRGTVRLDKNLGIDFRGEIASGALLIGNFYAAFDGQALKFSGKVAVDDRNIRFTGLNITDDESLNVLADASLRRDDASNTVDYRVHKLELHFPTAYQRYLESMAAPLTLDGLTVTGDLEWNGGSQGGVFSPGVFEMKDLSIVDGKRGRFAVTGLEAHVLSGQKNEASRFSWKGLLLQRINLGAGAAQVQAGDGRFSLTSPLRLEVLGGEVAIETFQVDMPGTGSGESQEPEIRLHASIEKLDMKQLTQALDWPMFEGSISGSIPGVTLRDGVLAVEGQIAFQVFDGEVLLTGLNVERPFGVLPSLAANLEVHDLDLQQVTSTFSFGHISGRMDGFVHDLRMLDWKPVAFDAWFGTPPGDAKSHEISRQAVNRLTSIGGGGATAALTGPVMKLFSNFSYRRLGLGCRLQNNTCEVRGLDDDDASVLIMEGAGIPKIMIRAFNRQMDFPQLVGGLTAAAEGEAMRVEH